MHSSKLARCLGKSGEGSKMKLIYRDKEFELRGGMTVRDAIRKVGLRPEGILALLDGKLITDDVIVGADDTVKLVAVISGG
jgi:sulfur carrier protein ThiS